MIDEIGTPPALYEVNDETKTNLNNPSFSQNTKDTNMNIDLSKLTPEQLAAFQTLENKITSLATELNNKTVELSAEKTTQLKNEVLQFCSADAKLKITPADKDKAVAFLMSQKNAGSQGVIEFSTADDTKVKFNAFEFAKELIMKLPDVIELSEMATNGTGKSASQQDIEYNAGIEAAKRINSNN
jgi:hypothetical protein